MAEEAAGAPLRAFGTIISMWILIRVISWSVTPDMVMDPVQVAIDHSAMRNKFSPINNSDERRRSAPISAGQGATVDKATRKEDLLLTSYTQQGSMDHSSAARSLPKRHFLLANMHEVDVNYRLPAGTVPEYARSISRGTEANIASGQNNPRGNGLSGYAWIFARQFSQRTERGLRKGNSSISNGQYGGSQAGIILSYLVSGRPDPEIAIYGRLTAALAPLAQEEAAFGLRMRPILSLPLSVHAEKRVDAGSGRDIGTAFYMTGGTGPDDITENIRIETYGQAGYVFGANDSYFFDGSATLQRSVAEAGRNKLYFGAGVWAGGERRITRLDVGPRADIRVPLGSTSARLSVDWRVRIAGNARPEDGLAITVSTGF